MSATRTLTMMLAATLAAGLSPAFGNPPAWAGGGHDKGDKHAEKRAEKAEEHADKRAEKAEKHRGAAQPVPAGAFFNDQHRTVVRNYYVTNYGSGKSCPPGLARKNNGCMPPGQYRKLNVGERVPTGVTYYAVPRPVLVQLPAVPIGYRYVRVGNDVVLLSPRSSLIVDVISGILG